MRNSTRKVFVGSVAVGGDAPITIQSMTNTDTRNVKETVKQIKDLEEVGCEIVRVAVPDMEAAVALKEIKKKINIPLVADIHFNYQLALQAMESGVDALRINPGNIGERSRVKAVVESAKVRGIPIRIGVNAGSLEKHLLKKYGSSTPQALVESALGHTRILEEEGFEDIVISVKASQVTTTIKAYQLLAEKTSYPLHLGVTEAGTVWSGSIKSAVGIGTLLAQGIGDTIRVSLTGSPVEEIKVGYQILKALNLREWGPEVISCPTCGRCQLNLIPIAEEIEKRCQKISKPLKIAVMGCVVNGPGEAREADIGIAGGKGEGLLFKKGEIIRKVPEGDLISVLWEEIQKDSK